MTQCQKCLLVFSLMESTLLKHFENMSFKRLSSEDSHMKTFCMNSLLMLERSRLTFIFVCSLGRSERQPTDRAQHPVHERYQTHAFRYLEIYGKACVFKSCGNCFCCWWNNIAYIFKLARKRSLSTFKILYPAWQWIVSFQYYSTLIQHLTAQFSSVLNQVLALKIYAWHQFMCLPVSVTRSGDLLNFGQLFKAFGSN